QHVREDRFARPLARAGGRAADEVYAAASRPRHEAAALHVAERVDAVAPRLGRGVVCARGPEAARDAEDGPGLDAISLDQAHAAPRARAPNARDRASRASSNSKAARPARIQAAGRGAWAPAFAPIATGTARRSSGRASAIRAG